MSTKSFKHPLSDTEPDIILRSSDGVNFNVHKSIMVHQSSVFRDILSIPQEVNTPNDADGDQTTSQSMDVSEDGKTLELLLQFCYLCTDPAGDLDLYLKVSKAAEKYNMESVSLAVKRHMALEMRRLTTKGVDPFHLYAISYAYGMVEEGQLAAKATLLHPMMDRRPQEDFDLLSVRAYHDLLMYRKACVNTLAPLLRSCRTMYPNGGVNFNLSHSPCKEAILRPEYNSIRSVWFVDHLDRINGAFAEVTAGATIQSPAILDMTITNMGWCSTCSKGTGGLRDLMGFNARLAAAVDMAIAMIPLPPIVYAA